MRLLARRLVLIARSPLPALARPSLLPSSPALLLSQLPTFPLRRAIMSDASVPALAAAPTAVTPAPAPAATEHVVRPAGEKKVKKGPAGGDAAAAGSIKHPLEMHPAPAYLDSRIEIFDRLKKAQDARIAGES